MCAAQTRPECLLACGAVVITGASSGIGEAFVKVITNLNPKAKFFNLSRTAPDDSLAAGQLEHCPADLSSARGQEAAITAVEAWLDGAGQTGGILLINNSGFGSFGFFPEPSLERSLQMIDLNIRAPVLLTSRLLSRLKERGGAIINISSTAAFQPTPFFAIYGGTKAFIMNWSLGLWRELRDTQVHVLCVCPGPTNTNFFCAAGFLKPPVSEKMCQTSLQVVQASLRALATRKPLVVCGWSNKLAVMISSRIPRVWVTRLTYMTLKKLSTGPKIEKIKAPSPAFNESWQSMPVGKENAVTRD
ncbi:MAG TPA: SDR family NAD(P)-dependent oxidoreductase [Opitutales bacterium]|jgi:short-subunit dehydrogenase|nr:SDR family NAD(P)-dependent oxidoreductase [Opitutales bacterium]